ncbi:hypothetical protein M0R45_026416 [Rubus argutus]|uniref:C-JID domain-containing protein n=1 Tax=Rubus argutus TaxID=59490 RepID=A0AAW1WYT0_RUBAR
MPRSQVKQLWTYGHNLTSLKHLNLRDSRNLIEVPDLSGSPSIERIDFRGCRSLVRVPSYFQNLENLASLDLWSCGNLKFFCEIPCNLEELILSGTAIEEISPSIWSHKKLHELDLSGCENLKSLPSRSNSTTGELNMCGGDQNQIGLKTLLLHFSNIDSLPDDSIYGLDTLYLVGCNQLKRLPPLSMGSLCSLRNLDLSGCEVLESIPDSLFYSSTLQDIDLRGTMIESIPSSIINASGLLDLRLMGCKKLTVIPELPSQLQSLDASGCTSLKRVASSRSALVQQPWEHRESFILERHVYTDCLELDESARINIMGDAQLRIMRMASSSKRAMYDYTFICPGNETPEWFSDQREGCEINNIKFPPDWSTTTQDQFLGFPLSAVVAVKPLTNSFFYLVWECNFKTNNDGEGYQHKFKSQWITSTITSADVNSYEDYVVAFFNRDSREGNSRPPIPLNMVTQASFHLYPVYNGNKDEARIDVKIKSVGFVKLN